MFNTECFKIEYFLTPLCFQKVPGVGLSRPLAKAGILMRCAMGKSVCAVAGPHPELARRTVLVALHDAHELATSPDVVLRVSGLHGRAGGDAGGNSIPGGYITGPCFRASPSSGSGTGPYWRIQRPRRLR